MDTTLAKLLKRRFAEARNFFKSDSNSTVAKVMGVSERTLRRYLDERDSAYPDLASLVAFAQHYHLSMDALTRPADSPKGTAPFRCLNRNVAILQLDEDWNVLFCSDAWAAVYNVRSSEITGTNMKRDWLWFADKHYPWMGPDFPNPRENILSTLTAVAREEGAASDKVWFVAPGGAAKRVLMRCWYLDPGYLFVDLPLDDCTDTVVHWVGRNDDNQIIFRIGDIEFTMIEQEIFDRWMAGWRTPEIMQRLDVGQEDVVTALKKIARISGSGDYDQMRENVWEVFSDGRLLNPYQVIRVDGSKLN